MGQGAGLTEEEILRITTGPDAPGLDEFETALLRAADELHVSRFVSDETWSALGERYSEDELREVVVIVGNYTQLAMFQNTLGAQLPPDVPRLPVGEGARELGVSSHGQCVGICCSNHEVASRREGCD